MLPLLLSASGVNGVGVNSSCMTVELCAYIARNEGFAYFGVEAGTCEEVRIKYICQMGWCGGYIIGFQHTINYQRI